MTGHFAQFSLPQLLTLFSIGVVIYGLIQFRPRT